MRTLEIFQSKSLLNLAIAENEQRESRRRAEAWDYMRQQEGKREALYFALRSRILTVSEMKEVEAYDYHLVIPLYPGVWTPREQAKREFLEALMVQFKLRLAA